MTTIQISVELHDRMRRAARESGLSTVALIEHLLDGRERRARMQAFGAAFRDADAGYWEEFREWDVALAGRTDAD